MTTRPRTGLDEQQRCVQCVVDFQLQDTKIKVVKTFEYRWRTATTMAADAKIRQRILRCQLQVADRNARSGLRLTSREEIDVGPEAACSIDQVHADLSPT